MQKRASLSAQVSNDNSLEPRTPSEIASSLQSAGKELAERHEEILKLLNTSHAIEDTAKHQEKMLAIEVALLKLRKNLSGSKEAALIIECRDLMNWANQLSDKLNADTKDIKAEHDKKEVFDALKACTCLFVLPYAAKNTYVMYFSENSIGAKIIPAIVAVSTFGYSFRHQIAKAWKSASQLVTTRLYKCSIAIQTYSWEKEEKIKTGFCQCRASIGQRASFIPRTTRKLMNKIKGAKPS